jgi:signal transduction histidine kinase
VNRSATRLLPRVVSIELGFALSSAALVSLLTPYFLLLSGEIAVQGATALALGVALGGGAGALGAAIRLFRYRYVVRALAVGSNAVEPSELRRLSEEPKHTIAGWLVPSAIGIIATTTVLRPAILDLTTGVTLCLLGLVITAAASLPLFVLVRAAFLSALELSPHEAMREVVEESEKKGLIGQRISRRMLAAVTTPVVFLAIGAALIVNAHMRRGDERDREETARVFARAALEAGPGVVARAGLDAAMEQGRVLGFSARVSEAPADYGVTRGEDGVVSLTAPLDSGRAEVRFNGSTVGFLSLSSLVVALFATMVASYLGAQLGTTLAHDLRGATRNIRDLGTEVVVSGSTSGTRILRAARFQVVAKLGMAIERVAQRFRVFAKAQERAIEARKAAARMRGLFFASVSHDLKSPLNAILGFTDLVRRTESITAGQAESLDFIQRRGRELLALIETILDAARVEAGQLKLMLDWTDAGALLNLAVQKGRDLASDVDVPVVAEVAPDVPKLRIDPVRMQQALATLVAHALRTTDAPSVRLVASLEPERAPALTTPISVRGPRALPVGARPSLFIELEIHGSGFSVSRLEAMLDPNRDPGVSEHRGLALGLRLARAVTELHGGKIEVKRKGKTYGSFVVTLPAQRTPGSSPVASGGGAM